MKNILNNRNDNRLDKGLDLAWSLYDNYTSEYGDGGDFLDEMIEQDLLAEGYSQTEVNLILEKFEEEI